MFCSETCKINSWKDYHKYECKMNSLMNCTNPFGGQVKMSLRAVCLAIKEAGSVSKLREKFEKSDKLDNNAENFLKDGNCCNDFWNVFNLSNLCHVNIMVLFIKKTILLLTALICETNFFKRNLKLLKGEELAKDEDVLFIGVLLLKLLMICSSNAESLYTTMSDCKKYQSRRDCIEKFCCIRGGHLTVMANFFKYDCNPNIIKCPTNDGKLAYYCLQPIKKNDLLSVALSNTFFAESKKNRQTQLYLARGIKCKCQACKENWPTFEILYSLFKSDITNTSRNSRKFPKNFTKINLWDKYKDFDRKFVEEDYQINGQAIIKDIAKDVSYVVRIYNQPSFMTGFIMDVLRTAVRKYHGYEEPFLQQECHNI